ncbi:maleylpyruvate isomerase N-terminal domain-containing protein [Nonomuraea sp. NEAU-A123]|uniref:maleylpyruvate isomerase N-terminal domain-containing protein n=1 Tax=Nonomuraea sp. NEAU-A123 TaxID=2839649 RepID=UPI001BE3F927|nr:maleylpyruvate isomerase N-terminal domain-containing protein [Nonomuraea sp. NEAU-A123]MBT2230216.1 maleylpyruvate isomerase N-terminal domain-containing protein [Nonomuraea sp. NEAU-A123]
MRESPPTTNADTTVDPRMGGVALLGRAIEYALGCLSLVTPGDLDRPTPCDGWDLRELLAHANDSFTALEEAAAFGHITLIPPISDGHNKPNAITPAATNATTTHGPPVAGDSASGGPALGGPVVVGGEGDPVIALRDRATSLLRTWANARAAIVSVGGCPLTAATVCGVGAVEVTVHAWDVARACGHQSPIPAPMAAELLPLAHLFATDADRPARFALPLRTAPQAPAQDRLLAYLGRDPHWTDNSR